MSKLIIDNQTETLYDHECFHYINKVINQGKISKTKNVKHFCHLTVFDSLDDGEITVHFWLNKSSSTFRVCQNIGE